MTIEIHFHGPVTFVGPHHDQQLEEAMSELTDVIQAQVAEDSVVVALLDKWEAQASSGAAISADELAADIATLKGEHDKLVTAVANDSTVIPGSSTTGTGPASAPGSAPGDPTVPPAGTTPVDTTVTPPVVEPPAEAPAEPAEAPAADVPAESAQ